MPAGSDHEPTAEPVVAAQQMREATDRLREQAWMVVPLTSAPVDAQDSDSAGTVTGADEDLLGAGCGKPVRFRRDAEGAVRRVAATAYRTEHAACLAAAGAVAALL